MTTTDLTTLLNRLREISATPPSNPATTTFKDSVGAWIVAACHQDGSLKTPLKVLYASYRAWCESSGIHPLAPNAFGRELSLRQFVAVRSGATRSRLGLGLKPDFTLPDPIAPQSPAIFYGTTAELLAIIKGL
jgi:hypothetical protein